MAHLIVNSAVEFTFWKIYYAVMRRIWIVLLLLASLLPASAGDAIHGKVLKVLPLLLDQKGRDAVSPSLFDRDAYQFYLRQHTNEISAVRFDVWWKATKTDTGNLKLRAELRGIGEGGLPTEKILEQTVTAGKLSKWDSLLLAGTDYQKLGPLVAWRVTLWNGTEMLGEQESFLW